MPDSQAETDHGCAVQPGQSIADKEPCPAHGPAAWQLFPEVGWAYDRKDYNDFVGGFRAGSHLLKPAKRMLTTRPI